MDLLTPHPLDNPAWSALITGNALLVNGDDTARYFDNEVSPFAALRVNTPENFANLHRLVPDNKPVLFVSPQQIDIPNLWKTIGYVPGVQMVHEGMLSSLGNENNLKKLTTADVPQMLALTKLTNPGPFNYRTIESGNYYGVFDGDGLVAMAGQRLHAENYVEISAVCTHPNHLGKGYARKLLQYQVSIIRQAGSIPYLHSRDDNYRAIAVYQSVGFSKRIAVLFYILAKNRIK